MVPAPTGNGPQAVYGSTVYVPRSPWLRLSFGESVLPGRIEEGRAAYLKITSARDGAVQYLNSESLAQWAGTSAYFNGDAVTVQLFVFPGSAPARISIRAVTAGEQAEGAGGDSICGATDDRTLSYDPRMARHLPEGCTTWLFNDTNHTFLTAGHCAVSPGDVQEFNVPLSTSTGAIVHPAPSDQYIVDPASIQFHFNGAVLYGEDFSYFACYPNSNTGLTPFQRQGQYFELASFVPSPSGQYLRITGYGITSMFQAPQEWNSVQKTGFGPYQSVSGTVVSHQVDTTGGNSGSPIEDLLTNRVIGIHTNGGCLNPAGTTSNAGCAISYFPLQVAIANPLSLCLTGRGIASPPLCVIGDGANNFGMLNTGTGSFEKIKEAPPRMEGMAYNPHIGRFYAISNDFNPDNPGRFLYTVNPQNGVVSLLTAVSGFADAINGLGYDPASDTLYGISQNSGQLSVIDTTSGVATTVGPWNPGTMIGALEFSPTAGALFGIDNAGGISRLVRWQSPYQGPFVVGALGGGISACNGLAVTDSGDLWTISAATGVLYRVNPFTGEAIAVGPTNGVFGNSFGMSAVLGGECYVNCDGSVIPPVLNANDFQCFLNSYAAGSPYANCDGSVVAPVLNANDFQCFMNAYAAGCQN